MMACSRLISLSGTEYTGYNPPESLVYQGHPVCPVRGRSGYRPETVPGTSCGVGDRLPGSYPVLYPARTGTPPYRVQRKSLMDKAFQSIVPGVPGFRESYRGTHT
jgi:hypothetical protein